MKKVPVGRRGLFLLPFTLSLLDPNSESNEKSKRHERKNNRYKSVYVLEKSKDI